MIGYVSGQESIELTLINIIDSGNFDCIGTECNVGGLIGMMTGNSYGLNANMNNCTQIGNIASQAEDDYLGGLIGRIDGDDTSTQMGINNCENSGDVTSKNGQACGLFYIHESGTPNISINNCVNKGKVSGIFARGISNIVNESNNIVSIGAVSGTNTTYLLWDTHNNVAINTVYGVKESCETCKDSYKALHRYEHDGSYYYIDEDSGNRADEILNSEAHEEEYGIYWTQSLDLSEHLNVNMTDGDGNEYNTKMNYGDDLSHLRIIEE